MQTEALAVPLVATSDQFDSEVLIETTSSADCGIRAPPGTSLPVESGTDTPFVDIATHAAPVHSGALEAPPITGSTSVFSICASSRRWSETSRWL
jgi:hypothetical protein